MVLEQVLGGPPRTWDSCSRTCQDLGPRAPSPGPLCTYKIPEFLVSGFLGFQSTFLGLAAATQEVAVLGVLGDRDPRASEPGVQDAFRTTSGTSKVGASG